MSIPYFFLLGVNLQLGFFSIAAVIGASSMVPFLIRVSNLNLSISITSSKIHRDLRYSMTAGLSLTEMLRDAEALS